MLEKYLPLSNKINKMLFKNKCWVLETCFMFLNHKNYFMKSIFFTLKSFLRKRRKDKEGKKLDLFILFVQTFINFRKADVKKKCYKEQAFKINFKISVFKF